MFKTFGKFLPLLAVVALFVTPAFCEDQMTAEILISKMEQAEKQIQGAQFDFEQEIAFTLTNERQKNSGQVKFKKPDIVFMRQSNPIEQFILADGKKVEIYTPSYNQVIVDSWEKWTNNSMIPTSLLSLGNNWEDLKKEYNFSYLGLSDGNYQLGFSPKQQAEGDKPAWQMKMSVDSKNFVPISVVLKSENFEATTITKNYQINPKFDKKAFKLALPKNVETIKLP
jgi:outer membrane lipoprotein carrier protein